MIDQIPSTRRSFLAWLAASGMCLAPRWSSAAGEPLTTRGAGDTDTPLFYRHDIGAAPGRMHEPTAGSDGNIWTSPLDGSLWRYHGPSGEYEVLDLQKLTGRDWKGLHLWPIAVGDQVYLCTPGLPELWVYDRRRKQLRTHAFPHDDPQIYGGFVVPQWPYLYLYDTKHSSVLKWNPDTQTGRNFPCPYTLSGTLYMTFVDRQRHEIWGSTYTGNDIVRFDTRREEWTGHFKSPLERATPTAANHVFGTTLYVSDHLHGRIVPLDIDSGQWGEAIAVPGFKDWFGYISGGWYFRGKLYHCHSTWTGGNGSLDGQPHHFLGSWSVFDPRTRRFARLDLPTREGEELGFLMSDYCATFADELYIFAVNQKPPHTAIVLRSHAVPKR